MKTFSRLFLFCLKDMGKRFAHWHRVSISVWSCWTRTNFDTFELACFFFSRRTSSAGDAVWRFFLQPDMSNNMPRQTDGSCRFFYSPFLFFNFFCFFSFCMTKNVFFRTKPPHPHVGQFQMWKNASWPFDGRPSHRLVGGGGKKKSKGDLFVFLTVCSVVRTDQHQFTSHHQAQVIKENEVHLSSLRVCVCVSELFFFHNYRNV